MKQKEYRIEQRDNIFYPQVKGIFDWKYFYLIHRSSSSYDSYPDTIKFDNLQEAKQYIERYKNPIIETVKVRYHYE